MTDGFDDPYRSPTVESAPPANVERSAFRGLSPEWTIFLAQTPLYVIFTAVFLLATFARAPQAAEALVRLASFELALFNARVLFCGPGSARVRIPLALACAFASTFLYGWFELAKTTLGSEIPTGVVISTEMRFFLASLVGPAVAAMLGSRDRRQSSHVESEPARSLLPLIIMASLGLASATIVALNGQAPAAAIVLGFFMQSVFIALLGFLVVQTWRLGIRGIERLFSWQTGVFAVGTGLTGFGFFTLLQTSIANPNMDVSVTFQILLVLGVVPVAREFFLRVSGCRAVNIYVEGRRAKKESAAGDVADVAKIA
jgi:hypothetical protein